MPPVPRPAIVRRPSAITIFAADGSLFVEGLAAEQPPKPSGGAGGWNTIDRPRRVQLVEWDGLPAGQLTIGLLFDRFAEDGSVEDQIRGLEALARPREEGKGQPPAVRVSGLSVPAAARRKEWVINDVAWGDALLNAKGRRVRQAVDITLLEATTEDLIAFAAKKRKVDCAKARAPKSRKLYTVRAGKDHKPESLRSIAKSYLGDGDCWKQIKWAAGKNKGKAVRDPKAVKVGDKLRLP